MKLTRLRLFGFKSYDDPTYLLSDKAQTVVDGPNGCG
jgi:chromosome segregation ATPase